MRKISSSRRGSTSLQTHDQRPQVEFRNLRQVTSPAGEWGGSPWNGIAQPTYVVVVSRCCLFVGGLRCACQAVYRASCAFLTARLLFTLKRLRKRVASQRTAKTALSDQARGFRWRRAVASGPCQVPQVCRVAQVRQGPKGLEHRPTHQPYRTSSRKVAVVGHSRQRWIVSEELRWSRR